MAALEHHTVAGQQLVGQSLLDAGTDDGIEQHAAGSGEIEGALVAILDPLAGEHRLGRLQVVAAPAETLLAVVVGHPLLRDGLQAGFQTVGLLQPG